MHSWSGLRSVLVLACLVIGMGAALAEEFKLADRRLTIEPPAGFCAMDRRAPLERPLFDGQEQASATIRVLALQVDCRELDAYRAGEAYLEDMTPSILVLASLDNGQPLVVGVPRAQFSEVMEGAMQSITEAQMQEIAAASGNVALGVIKETLGAHYADAEYRGIKYLGVLGRDETAVYIGQVSQFLLAGKPWTETAVAATTLINGVVITVSYAEAGDDPEAVGAILAEVRRVTRELIALNEGNL